MIEPPRFGRGTTHVERSQLALEVALNAIALGGAALLLRLAFLLLGINRRIWTGAAIYGLTDPLVWPLKQLPGGNRQVIRDATLADLTAIAIILLVPLALLGRDRTR